MQRKGDPRKVKRAKKNRLAFSASCGEGGRQAVSSFIFLKMHGGVGVFYGAFDGAAMGNPGPGGAGALIEGPGEKCWLKFQNRWVW